MKRKSILQSIGFRIIAFYILLSFVTISFILTIIFENQVELITRNKMLESEKKLTQLISSIKGFTIEAGKGSLFDTEEENGALSHFADMVSQHYTSFIIFKEDGSVLHTPSSSVTLPDDSRQEASRALAEKAFTGKEYLMRIDETNKEFRFYIPLSDFHIFDTDGTLLFIREQTDDVHTALGNLYSQALYVALVVFLFHFIFAIVLYRGLVRPLNILSKMAQRLSRGKLNTKVSFTGRKDEIGTLATSFNDMSDALSQDINSLKHEVKTAHFISEVAEKIATRDIITGLVNINYLTERIHEGITRAQQEKHSLSLLLLNIDNFREMNEMYGKQNTNILLVEAAKRIQTHCVTDITARSRWSEFAVFSPDTSPDYLRKSANQLKQSIESEVIVTPDGPLTLSVSIGAVYYTADHVSLLTDYNDISARASAALETAQEKGAEKIEIIS